jgi:DNA-binding IscR family transcriptional regulator
MVSLPQFPASSHVAYERCSCPDEETCGLRIAMQQIRDAIVGIMDNYKLDRLIDEVKEHLLSKKTEWQFEI